MSLPILSRSFFSENPPSKSFFAQWKSIYSWSEKIIPLYHWEGILYVGCLGLPKSLPKTEMKIVFLLCDSESLAQTWEIFNSIAQPKAHLPNSIPGSAPKVPAADDMFAALESTSISKVGSLKPKEDTSFDSLSREMELEPEAAPEESLEMSDESSHEDSSEESASEISADEELAAETLNIDLSAQTSTASILKAQSNDQPKNEAKLEENTYTLKTNMIASTASAPIKEMPPEKRSTPTSTEVLYKKPGALSSNKDLSEASRIAIKVQSPAQADGFIHELFKEMSYHYTKSMVLMKNKDSVTPWKWDSNFELKGQSPVSVPLETPSPFRVVNKTQKSFHGYVVLNDINEKFFEEWNQSQTPEHMTISPIVVEEEVIGMVLGIGNKDADNKTSLLLTEKVAGTLSKQMQKQPTLFKAA